MNYMGWRDVHSALRYVHAGESFGDWRLATGDAMAHQSRIDYAADNFIPRYRPCDTPVQHEHRSFLKLI